MTTPAHTAADSWLLQQLAQHRAAREILDTPGSPYADRDALDRHMRRLAEATGCHTKMELIDYALRKGFGKRGAA